ncbi:MAG: hypothetical protein HYX44_06625 [Aquabacterium sp.]|nr:hypothetical protein [Aquabacterium sp.]
MSIIGTNDKVSINSWYLGDNYKVESITAAGNAKTLDYTKVDALVSAMAALTPPALGQTNLSTYQHSKLDTLLASSWT